MINQTLQWLASALAVSLAIVAMLVTQSLHPPGGATSVLAVIGSPAVKNSGYYYVIFPALISSTILVTVALLMDNLSQLPQRAYPAYWNVFRRPRAPETPPLPLPDDDRRPPAAEHANGGGVIIQL